MSHLTARIAEGALLGDGSIKPTLSNMLSSAPADGDLLKRQSGIWTPVAPAATAEVERFAYAITHPVEPTYTYTATAYSSTYRNFNFYRGNGAETKDAAYISALDGSSATGSMPAAYGTDWTTTFRISGAGTWLFVATPTFAFSSSASTLYATMRLKNPAIATYPEDKLGPMLRYDLAPSPGRRASVYMSIFTTTGATTDARLYMQFLSGITLAPPALNVCVSVQITKLG